MITLPTISPDQDIGQLIVHLYDYAIAIVGLAVFIQFLRAGFAYFGAAGNASETSHAKEMMQNAILGTILLFSAYLILNVINPDLTKANLFKIPTLSPVPKKVELVNGEPVPKTKTYESGAAAKVALENSGVKTGNANLDGMSHYAVTQITSLRRTCNSEHGKPCLVDVVDYVQTQSGKDLVKFTGDSNFDDFMLSTYIDQNYYLSSVRKYDPFLKAEAKKQLFNDAAPVIIDGQVYQYDNNYASWYAEYKVSR